MTSASPAVDTDLIVVGAGPAGAAAAIAARNAGLHVTMIEREASPRPRPGEAVHPGIEPLLARLGVRDDVLAADFLRHDGHWVAWGIDERRFVPFGTDADGPWHGFQMWRPAFDAIMIEGARRRGAALIRPCRRLKPIVENRQVTGVATSDAMIRGRYVIDASGRQRWLARHLGLADEQTGPSRLAWFGYATGSCAIRDDAPAVVSDADGWTWTARVRPGVYQWVRISLGGNRPPRGWLPDEFAGLTPWEGARGIDVTWSRVQQAAGAGYFLTGDAAFVLDPASSHGVLKAVMSGMMAAHHATAVLRGAADADAAARDYDGWMHDWFRNDVAELQKQYNALDAA